MSFLLHHDTCIRWFLGNQRVRPRLVQNHGSLHLSTLTVYALSRWALLPTTAMPVATGFQAFVALVRFADVTEPVALRAAMLGSRLGKHNLRPLKLLVAATALEAGLTLVTRDPDFALVPGLATVDWSAP